MLIIKALNKIYAILLCVILLSCGYEDKNTFEQPTNFKNDSISFWIKSSKKSSLSLEKRRSYLKSAYNITKFNKIDTLTTRALSKIAYQYLKLKDTTRFKELNKEAYQLALNIKDTFSLADIHWNNANYYKKIEVYDTAYYHYNKAYNYFESIEQQNFAAKMLYGMSFIKGRYKDYSESEILIIKAISKYKLLKENKALYASYNHLALLQSDVKEYDRALFYHGKAVEYLGKLKDKKDFYETSLNNIGLVYLEKGEYQKGLSYFNQILKNDSLIIKDIGHYARVLDNRAYCKLLKKDTVNLKQDFFIALEIRDSIKSKGGIVISKIHLSEYYSFSQDTIIAIKYAKEANILAKEIHSSGSYLASLKLLSKLDKKEAKTYLEKYIVFSDSLQGINRKIQNKFTRIAYETDEYIKETELLLRQKTRILIISLTILFILSLTYYIVIQRSRNEKLLLETDQQKANEQVYILTLEQQTKLEEEKTKERNRISQELHDGILGKLFGIRIDLGFLEIKGDDNTLKQHELFLDELQNIEKEIREVSHKLNVNFDSSEIDFSYILRPLLENNSRLGNFEYQLSIDESIAWVGINEIIKVNLFRLLQEVLQNIVKHSKAKKITLNFSIEKNNLIVNISDNGIGFDVSKRKKGIGIKNMKSRTQKLKGAFKVQSETGRTTIHFTIPIH